MTETQRNLAFAFFAGLLVAFLELSEFFYGIMLDTPDFNFYVDFVQKHYYATGNLWFDACFNGISLINNPTFGLFYLPNYLHGAMDFSTAKRLVYAVHYGLLNLGLFWFGCQFAKRQGVALTVATLLTASGLVMSMVFRAPHLLLPMVWLPWVGTWTLRFFRSQRALDGCLVGLGMGLAVLAGDIFACVYALCIISACIGSMPGTDLRTYVRFLALSAAPFFCTCGFVFYHSLSALHLSFRATGMSPEEALSYSFHPIRMIEFFFQIFGAMDTKEFSGGAYTSSLAGTGAQWWYPTVYFGPLSAFLLAVAVKIGILERRYRAFAVFTAALMFFAFGRWNPLVSALAAAFPGAIIVRFPARLVLPAAFIGFPLFVVAAERIWVQCSAWGEGKIDRRLIRAGAIAALLVPVILQPQPFRFLLKGFGPTPDFVQILRNSSIGERRTIFPFAWPKQPQTYENTYMTYAGPILWGEKQYRCTDATKTTMDLLIEPSIFAYREARENFGLTHAIVLGAMTDDLQKAVANGELRTLAEDARGPLRLLEDPQPVPRIFMVRSWQTRSPTSKDDMLRPSVREGAAVLDDLVFLDGQGRLDQTGETPAHDAYLGQESSVQPACHGEFTGDFKQGDLTHVETRSPCPSLLIVNARFTPGWRATIDGTPTSIGRVNDQLLGIKLEPGTHKITLQFKPPYLEGPLALSLALQIFGFLGLGLSLRKPD